MRFFSIQLTDLDGRPLATAGGKVYVAENGSPAKQAIADKDGAPATNPLTPNAGKIEFYVADNDVTTVDLYGITADGYAFQVRNVVASGPNEIKIDTSRRVHVLVIPFHQDDFTANAETDSGFDEPANAIMLPAPFVRVVDADDTETINVGTDSNDSGDADGFIAGASLAVAGVVKGTIANSANTLGALFEAQDSANAGDLTHEGHVSGGKSITYTTSSGADSGSGFIHLPYVLAA